MQAFVHKSVMEELKRVIDDSEVMHEDDGLWPPPDRIGRQVTPSLSTLASLFAYSIKKISTFTKKSFLDIHISILIFKIAQIILKSSIGVCFFHILFTSEQAVMQYMYTL